MIPKTTLAGWYSIAAFLVFFALVAVFRAPMVKDIFDSLSFGMALVVCMSYLPSVVRAFRSSSRPAESMMVIAIFAGFATLLYQRTYVIVYNHMDRPKWLLESGWAAFIPYSITIIGAMYLIAPGVYAIDERSRSWWHLVSGLVLGAAMAGFVIGRYTVD